MADGDSNKATNLARAAENVTAFIENHALAPERGAELLLTLLNHRCWFNGCASARVIEALLYTNLAASNNRLPKDLADSKGCQVVLDALAQVCGSTCQAATALLAGCWQLGLPRNLPAEESELHTCFRSLLLTTKRVLTLMGCVCRAHQHSCREAAVEQLLHTLLALWSKHESLHSTARWSGK